MEEQAQVKEQEVREAWWWEAEKIRPKALDYLRKATWSKGTTGGKYLPGVSVGLERAYWWTKSFMETDGLPWVERRAQAMATYLQNVPIFIIDHSRLVGYHCERPNQVMYHVEVARNTNEDLYYDPDKLIPEEEKDWIQKCHAFWSNKCMQVLTERYLSQQEQIGIMTGPVMSGVHLDGSNSAVFDYDFVFENGLNGIMKMIEGKEEEAQTLLSTGPGTPDTLPLHEKIDEWRSMKITAEAVIQWANRYSRLAKIIAENFESDPKRKAELIKISEICAKVPANPVEHFHEAIQCERFIGLAARWIERGHGGWAERLDQIYWPYYRKDVQEAKTLSREEAVELLGENNIRIYEVTGAVGRGFRAAFQGAPVHLPTITIGGVDENGRDASNDLTDAVLESCRLVRVSEPSYMFRYHPQVRLSTLKAAYETIRQGMGYPSFQHEGVSQDTLMHNFGATLEEARSYANVVCMSPGVTKGRGGQGVRYAACFTNGYSSFMLALFDGFEPFVMRMQIGPHSGDPTTFQTFDEFFEAMRAQERFMYEMAARVRNKGRHMEARYMQQPFGSALFKRCIDSGIDMVDARSEPLSNAWLTRGGGADIIDCLYSMKRLVFDDKKYTMAELQEALRANWVGFAEMRQEFLNLPKFGNDVEDVDEMAGRLYGMFADECNRNVEAGGGRYMPLPEFAAGWAAAAMMMGAMPNGRRQGDNLYDGGISPGAGFDRKGPTAVLRSVSRIDHRRLKQCLLNQRLTPTQLSGEKGFQLWINYMKTWYDLGVPHVQFNMVDNETLRAAQREPEKYQELIVRVAGYSAHFVELNALTQEGIIERTIQEI